MTNTITATHTGSTGNASVSVANVTADDAVLEHLLSVDITTANKTMVEQLAHYNASANGTTVGDGGSKTSANAKLSTAYEDAGGHYHGIDGDNDQRLFAPVSLTISINTAELADGHGWSGDYYVEGGTYYSKTDLATQLNGLILSVYVKETSSSRLRLFENTAASGDPYLGDFAEGDKSDGYVKFNLAVDVDDWSSSNILTKTITVTAGNNIDSCFFYVYGGAASDAAAETVAVTGTLDVKITSAAE